MVLAAAVYQIPNTEHMAYRLVRTLVYKRGVGIRETVWVGVWFGKSTSVLVFSTYVALYRRYPRSGSASYLPTRAAPLALAHKSYLPTPGLGGGGVIPRIAAGLRDGCRQPRRASAARLPGSSRQPAAAHLEARERLPGTCVAAKDK